MDGGRRALLGDLTDGRAKHSSTPGPPHRCGWCGLLPLPEDQALSEERPLRRVLRHLEGCRLDKPFEQKRFSGGEMNGRDDA